ncbi:hypothetical protein EVAR_7879_1 [Eumeta japonica]|uniref:Uncharacterized protein n=1 Tax=Eumeta variegata TaxID=151549 RepID=A0A4C1TW29_EUMVA|nr:hypothetical protein EVAR_7879_1 [Eumeta japonica]
MRKRLCDSLLTRFDGAVYYAATLGFIRVSAVDASVLLFQVLVDTRSSVRRRFSVNATRAGTRSYLGDFVKLSVLNVFITLESLAVHALCESEASSQSQIKKCGRVRFSSDNLKQQIQTTREPES